MSNLGKIYKDRQADVRLIVYYLRRCSPEKRARIYKLVEKGLKP